MSERGTERRLGFKKPGLKERLALFALLPFLGASLFLAWAALEAWKVTRRLDAHRGSFFVQEEGPVYALGTVTRTKEVTSPLGKQGVGWVGALGYMKTHKSRTWFEPVCVRADLSELQLGSDAGLLALPSWLVTFARPDEPVALATSAQVQDDLPLVDLGALWDPSPAPPIPASMRGWCGGARGPAGEELSYREAVLATGARVTVLGCARQGRVTRCGDGVDLLTSGDWFVRKAEARTGTAVFLVFGGIWNLLMIGGLGFVLRSRLVRAKLTFEEAMRAQ